MKLDKPRALVSLKVLYEGMPTSTGCETCLDVNGEDDLHWCCTQQNPNMFHIEYEHATAQISHWSRKKRVDLIERALRGYLSRDFNQACIFYDGGCTIYETRPFACRMFGVIPKETWDEGVAKFLVDHPKVIARPQCDLVRQKTPVTASQHRKWSDHIRNCELQSGRSEREIRLHDKRGGGYRTFYEHILIELCSMGILDTDKLGRLRDTEPDKNAINEEAERVRSLLYRIKF